MNAGALVKVVPIDVLVEVLMGGTIFGDSALAEPVNLGLRELPADVQVLES